jgi:signal transduction histidine kinase
LREKNKDQLDFLNDVFGTDKQLKKITSDLENCDFCSTMLLNLINDLLDLAKLEKMKFQLNNSFFDLTKTI